MNNTLCVKMISSSTKATSKVIRFRVVGTIEEPSDTLISNTNPDLLQIGKKQPWKYQSQFGVTALSLVLELEQRTLLRRVIIENQGTFILDIRGLDQKDNPTVDELKKNWFPIRAATQLGSLSELQETTMERKLILKKQSDLQLPTSTNKLIERTMNGEYYVTHLILACQSLLIPIPFGELPLYPTFVGLRSLQITGEV